jgi:hypothetical protein
MALNVLENRLLQQSIQSEAGPAATEKTKSKG